jgi:hypothetical protein
MNNVTFFCILGHSWIQGPEDADTVARKGFRNPFLGPNVGGLKIKDWLMNTGLAHHVQDSRGSLLMHLQ